MNLLERVLTLLRANLNNVVEKADDPEKALRQLQLDMRNQLVQVKTQVAMAIAESHRQQKRSQERLAEADSWFKQAEQAVQQGNDRAAKAALARYNDMLKQASGYQQQQKEQEQLIATLRKVLRQLETKIAEVETTIETLAARKRSALIQQRVLEALQNSGKTKNKESAQRAQDAVMEAEARARALMELQSNNLDEQLDQLTEEQRIERQLQSLKEQQGRQQPPLLQEGRGHPSPYISPQPQSGEPARRRSGNRAGQTKTPEEVKHGKDTTDPADISAFTEEELARLRKLR